MVFGLSACADLSMYNQVPAPIGGTAATQGYPAQQSAKTYAIDEQSREETMYYGDNAPINNSPTSNNPAVIALLDSAYQQSSNGQLDIAASKLERAVRIAPRDPQVWQALAKVRYQQRKYALAISLAKKSNVLSEADKSLQRDNWLLMASCYEGLGNTSSAQQARANANRLY